MKSNYREDTVPTPDLEFFLDPACPFCWMTSKWVRLVAEEIDLDVRWSYISLVTLNEPYDDDDGYRESHWVGRRLHRVLAAAAEAHGEDVVGPLYEAIGTRTWEVEGLDDEDAVREHLAAGPDVASALRDVGLPVELAAAVDDDSFDELFVQGTKEALSRTGEGVGTPIITFDPDGENPASFFGPVISELPDPEQSVAFYRAIETAARVPSFAELKRSARTPLDLPTVRALH